MNSPHRQSPTIFRIIHLTLIIVLLFFMSCKKKSPGVTEPNPEETPPGTQEVAGETIGSTGGDVGTSEFLLTVPPGAFGEEVDISLFEEPDTLFGESAVSNMFTFMKTIPPYWEPMLKMMYEMVGNPTTDSVMLREVSPVYHVDKIVAPLFIAQGANDPRVNIDESDQIVEAMKARGVTVEYMVKNDEGHGFRNEENRFDFYREMEAFLKKEMGEKK